MDVEKVFIRTFRRSYGINKLFVWRQRKWLKLRSFSGFKEGRYSCITWAWLFTSFCWVEICCFHMVMIKWRRECGCCVLVSFLFQSVLPIRGCLVNSKRPNTLSSPSRRFFYLSIWINRDLIPNLRLNALVFHESITGKHYGILIWCVYWCDFLLLFLVPSRPLLMMLIPDKAAIWDHASTGEYFLIRSILIITECAIISWVLGYLIV